MWWLLSFASAALLGCYDSFKKISLKDNAVIPVLFFNTLISTVLLLPLLIRTGFGSWEVQRWIVLKSAIVLSSWLAGYYAMKHLPLTLVGPINATRPVLVLLGAVLLFGERLNLVQWLGVAVVMTALFLSSRSAGHDTDKITSTKGVAFMIVSVLSGAASALWDRVILQNLEPLFVQSWTNLYITLILAVVLLIREQSTPFRWQWSIPLISVFLVSADFLYFQALSQPGALIAVISMIRRGSAVVSFLIGAFFLKEQNIKSKAFDLALLLLSMVFLYLGSR